MFLILLFFFRWVGGGGIKSNKYWFVVINSVIYGSLMCYVLRDYFPLRNVLFVINNQINWRFWYKTSLKEIIRPGLTS